MTSQDKQMSALLACVSIFATEEAGRLSVSRDAADLTDAARWVGHAETARAEAIGWASR